MSQPSPAATGQPPTNSPTRNAAVQRCCAARDLARAECRARNAEKFETQQQGAKAFCNALPDLSGYENIRDFIACISHGLLSGDISTINSPQFLYAAQVAISALRLEPKEKKQTPA
jgi:hypothetical protein